MARDLLRRSFEPASGLLFGATSITGYALASRFAHELIPVATRSGAPAHRAWLRLAVEDHGGVAGLIETACPHLVIYAHAVCDVAKCEADPDWAYDLNVRSVENLVRLLPAATRLVYVSSDHVFGADGRYDETCEPAPISVYGRTRVAAEHLVLSRPGSLVVRPALAVGPSADGRSGHFDWLRYRYRKGLPITIIADEARSAVWSDDLADRIMDLALAGVAGLRHLAAAKLVARPELATHLMQLQGLPAQFGVRRRADQPVPHLGRVALRSVHRDPYGAPLPSAVDYRPLVCAPQFPFEEVTA